MTQEERLQKLKELRNPTYGLLKSVQMLKGDQGPAGPMGPKPILGVDYYTEEDIDSITKYIQSRIIDGEKGDKGDKGDRGEKGDKGERGQAGITPIRGFDYWTEEDKVKIIADTLKQIKIPTPKDGVSPKVEDIVKLATEELKKVPFDINKILRDPQLRMLLHGGQGPASIPTVSLTYIIDGGGSAITTGLKGVLAIPFNMTITGWEILGDQTGSIVIDVWKDTYANYPPVVGDSITGSDKPTLSSSTKNSNLAVTSWLTGIVNGDILAFNVDSVDTVQRVTISIIGVKN